MLLSEDEDEGGQLPASLPCIFSLNWRDSTAFGAEECFHETESLEVMAALARREALELLAYGTPLKCRLKARDSDARDATKIRGREP